MSEPYWGSYRHSIFCLLQDTKGSPSTEAKQKTHNIEHWQKDRKCWKLQTVQTVNTSQTEAMLQHGMASVLYQYPRGAATENLGPVVLLARHTNSFACALLLFECVTLATRAFLAVPHGKALEGSPESIAVLVNRVRLLPWSRTSASELRMAAVQSCNQMCCKPIN